LVNILILRLCNYDKSPDHVVSAGKFTLKAISFAFNRFPKVTGSPPYLNVSVKLDVKLFDAVTEETWEILLSNDVGFGSYVFTVQSVLEPEPEGE
jgi:hypothetical protein